MEETEMTKSTARGEGKVELGIEVLVEDRKADLVE